MESVIFGFVWATIFFGILGAVIYKITTFTNGRSFDDYKRLHGNHVKNGKVSCHSCGSSSIYLRKVGNSLTNILNSHVCRQCGTELYRSKTRV